MLPSDETLSSKVEKHAFCAVQNFNESVIYMKLLVHIGTQKTATTSIQHFCVHNRKLLKSCGYLYPKNNSHPFLFNFLAQQLVQGRQDRVARYLQKVRTQGQRKKCHTVIISAESFYAMSFFFLSPREESRASEYWQIEARLIEELSRCCDGYDDIKIACYLRPQDDFAAAFYNQLVKISPYFDETYKEFIEGDKPIFDYERHIRLWEKYFGADSISIRNFLTCKRDIVEDFLENFLEPGLFSKSNEKQFRSNLRLNRDVLEFKRVFNSTDPDKSLANIGIECHKKINPQFVDKPGYQVFASQDYRKQFFGLFSDGNDILAERYCLGKLPVIANEQDPTYPGLNAEKSFEIYLRLQFLLDKPGTRFKLAVDRLENILMSHFPGGRWLLYPVRKLRVWLRSRILER